MEANNEAAQDLAHIREVLDRHTKFLSLSGLSGIASGFVALAGVAIAYLYLTTNALLQEGGLGQIALSGSEAAHHLWVLGVLAILVFALALGLAAFFTQNLAKRNGYTQVWNGTSRRMAAQLFVPVAVGAVFCLLLALHHLSGLIAPCTLVFYGLGLYSASKYTFKELSYLGLAEMVLGLLSFGLPGLGLLIWAVGFGLLNILYGIFTYYTYEYRRA